MRVLVTGASGLLGSEVVSCFAKNSHDVVSISRSYLDITNRSQVLAAVGAAKPDVVVNCAAFTAVDDCETNQHTAYATNALAVRYLAEAARRAGAHLCHISSDYVFSGKKTEPYHEWDEPAPLSIYGASKLSGEQEAGEAATIVRTAWLCGTQGNNVVKAVLRLASQGETMSFVTDQRGSPSFAVDVAAVIQRLCVERCSGIYHVANQGSATWYELAQQVLTAAGHTLELVAPVTTAELSPPRLASRPVYSVLENRALKLANFVQPPTYVESLDRLVKALVV